MQQCGALRFPSIIPQFSLKQSPEFSITGEIPVVDLDGKGRCTIATQQNLKIKNLLIAQAATTTITGTSVDLQGFINPGGRNMKAFVDVQNVVATTPSITVKIQDSPNNTTFTDITGAAFTAITTNGSANTPAELHFVTNNRYVRAVATYGSTHTSSAIYAGLIVESENT